MDQISLPIIVLRGIPETTIMVALALVLTGYEAKLTDVLIVGVIGGLIGVLIRSSPISLGANILIMLPMIGILIAIFCRIDFLSAIIVASVGAVVFSIIETAYIFTFVKITGITIKQIMSELHTRLLFPLPEYAILILLLFVCKRRNWTFLNIREFNNMRRIRL